MKKRIISIVALGLAAVIVFGGCAKETTTENNKNTQSTEAKTKSKADIQADTNEAKTEEQTEVNADIQFDSTTVGDGSQIDTSIFVPYKLTAVNIWATWCNPCVNELPELQKVYEELPEDVNFLGLCMDAADEPELAKEILEKAGVKYESIIATEDMTKEFLFSVQAYPTTIFVDGEGNLVGEPLVGAPPKDVAETYLKVINEHLTLLEK